MDSNAPCCCFQAVSKRSRRRKSQDNSVAEIGILDTRILLSAVNDSATLSGTQNSVEIDVLGNDTGMSKSIVSVGNLTNNTNGGMVTYTNSKLTHSIPSVQIKTLGEYTIANNIAMGKIAAWHAIENGFIGAYYTAVSETTERFGEFLSTFSEGLKSMGGIVASGGQYLGSYYGAAGKAISFLASAGASSTNSSNTSILLAAQQHAAIARQAEVMLADEWAQVL